MARLTLILACLALLAACKPGQTETRTTYRADTILQTRIDTLRVIDSRQADKHESSKVDEWHRYVDSTAVKDTVRVTLNADGSTNTERMRYITRYVGNTKELTTLQSRMERYRDSLNIFRAKCDSMARSKDRAQVDEKVRKEDTHWWHRLIIWLSLVGLYFFAIHIFKK